MSSRAIRIDDETYNKLDKWRGKHETYSQAIERLLDLQNQLNQIIDVIEGQLRYTAWQREQLEKAKEAVS